MMNAQRESDLSGQRHQGRAFALQMLYQLDLQGGLDCQRTDLEGAAECCVEAFDEAGYLAASGATSRGYAIELVLGAAAKRGALDTMIESAAVHWRMVRMAAIDRNIIRLAAYELTCCADIPAAVAINEAVELAKRYGGAESAAFVNGILDRIHRDYSPHGA